MKKFLRRRVQRTRGRDTGDLTEQYLADRAMMLQAMLHANTNDMSVKINDGTTFPDTTAGWAQQRGEDIYYQDITVEMDGSTLTTTEIYQGNNITDNIWLPDVTKADVKDMWQFQFGSAKNDILTGGNMENHLYGGAGDDGNARIRGAANDQFIRKAA